MKDFLEIKCLNKKEQKTILDDIEKAIAKKKKEGILTEREVREIAEMKLRALIDIQDVQSVYDDLMFK
jgi:hypothetical protein